MPEIRYNIITREWVIIATERAKRPEDFAKANPRKAPLLPHDPKCVFCTGNEHLTPPETMRIPRNGSWQVRVVPNKFSALSPTGELTRNINGLKRTIAGVGLHEVIVESPAHDKTLALLNEKEFGLVLEAYQRRYEAVTNDPRIAHVTLFKNHGERAGCSLEHPHSQLVGTPIIPPQVRERMENALRFYDETGDCIFCAVMADELLDQSRIIAQSEHFVAFIPYAALTPFHLWIFPLQHKASFLDATPEELQDCARMLRSILRKIYFGLENPDFNLSVRTPPREASGLKYYHWYLSVIPRVTRVAGFEIGSGMFINVALPEKSAEFLRNAPEMPASQSVSTQ
jgi:UDPglucose--hexose-1-phosphate uridylyltransferase